MIRAVIAVAALFTLHTPPLAQSERRPDDEQIVQTALLAFFAKKGSKLPIWAEGDFVAVRPKWASKQRGDFDRTLVNLAKAFDAGEHGKELQRIRAATADGPIPVEDDPQPLVKLRLDERIVVTEVPAEGFGIAQPRYVRNRSGKEGTIRVSGWLEPPTYSRNRDYAILILNGLSHAIGSGGSSYRAIYFILRRNQSAWQTDLALVSMAD